MVQIRTNLVPKRFKKPFRNPVDGLIDFGGYNAPQGIQKWSQNRSIRLPKTCLKRSLKK